MKAQTIVVIIQTALYVPGLAMALYVLVRNWHSRPRQAWYPAVPFSILRLVGGIDVICLDRNPDNIALIVVALMTLGIGLIPLIISILGLIRTILDMSIDNSSMRVLHHVVKGLRVAFGVAATLLICGGSLISDSGATSTARTLSEVGYVIFASVILVESAMLWKLGRYRNSMASTGSLIYFRGAALSIPLLLLRAIYSLLSEFNSRSLYSEWNPVFGSSVAFALMALLPEYLVLVILMYLGCYRIKQRKGTLSFGSPDSASLNS